MPQCHIVIYGLGVVALAYLTACLFYVVATRFMGKPFNDSLTDKQKEIKKKSSKQRGYVFWISFVVSLIIIGVLSFYMA